MPSSRRPVRRSAARGIVPVTPRIRLSRCVTLNNKYRYFKFCCNNDGDVNIEYDYLLRSENPENSADGIMFRFVKIIDEVYPQLMHALWG